MALNRGVTSGIPRHLCALSPPCHQLLAHRLIPLPLALTMNQSTQNRSVNHRFSRAISWLAPASIGLMAATTGMAILDGTLIRQPMTAHWFTGQPAVAQPQPQPRLRWTPKPDRGNAQGTLSGGRRGQESATCGSAPNSTRLTLLVPAGRESLLTTAAQPTLAWQLATPKPTSLRFILSDVNRPTPIYTQTLTATTTGIQSVTLPRSVSLINEQTYRWTVIVTCPEGQKSEIYARSFIRRTSREFLGQQLSQRLGQTSVLERSAVFAEHGIWYDAIGLLLTAQMEAPSAEPNGPAAALAMLLQQAVPSVAPFTNGQLANGQR